MAEQRLGILAAGFLLDQQHQSTGEMFFK